jgi:hypothetical protein
MGKMYSQQEAVGVVGSLSNNNFQLLGTYRGSDRDYNFKHLLCGKVFVRRWSNFVDAFRNGSPHYKCPHCKI